MILPLNLMVVAATASAVSMPVEPSIWSPPAPPIKVLALASPVRLSSKADPVMFSNPEIVSLSASPPDAVSKVRSIETAAEEVE